MIYLDYSATTPVLDEVLDTFNNAVKQYIANPNSSHKLGKLAKDAIDSVTNDIATFLNIKSSEIIYTSGASESNNLAIKGTVSKKNGKHIITTLLEHSSIIAPISYLQKQGYEVDFVNLTNDGHIDLEHLESLLKEETVLLIVSSVNSELGIKENLEQISLLVKQYPNCTFMVDITQSIGKHHIDLTNIDLASFSAQKFYGLKGIGGLIKKDHVTLEPLIHGGKSTTIYRSGTPALPLILSLKPAFVQAFYNLDDKYKYVTRLNNKLRTFLEKYEDVFINSPIDAIPHILNFSIINFNAERLIQKFDEKEIYLSSQTACSLDTVPSRSILAVTNDIKRATSSLRISLSYLTKEKEIDMFMEEFDNIYKELNDKSN
jgi:cysteine desulfurase